MVIKDNFIIFLAIIFIFGSVGTELLRFFEIVPPSLITNMVSVEIWHYQLAAIQALIFLAISFLLRPKLRINSNIISGSNGSTHFKIFGILILFTLFFTYQLDFILSDSISRFIGNQTVNRLIFLFAVFLLIFELFFTVKKNYLLIFVLFFIAMAYPAAIASRLVTLPFLVLTLYFFYNKKWLWFLLFSFFSFQALSTAFIARAEPSFFGYIEIFFDPSSLNQAIEFIPILISLSFPGIETIAVVSQTTNQEHILDTLLYLSPIPSSFLDPELFFRSSLSPLLGIDIFQLGINSDIYSEGLYRQGVTGFFLMPAVIPISYYLVIKIANQFNHPLYNYLMVLLTRIFAFYAVVGGMVFSYRAATRFLLLLLLASMFMLLFKKRELR